MVAEHDSAFEGGRAIALRTIKDRTARQSISHAENRGIKDYLCQKGIGYILLKARSDPFKTDGEKQSETREYMELFNAQLSDNIEAYIQSRIARSTASVTIASSPSDAGKLLAEAKQKGKQEEGDGEKGEGEDGQKNDSRTAKNAKNEWKPEDYEDDLRSFTFHRI
jgi:hypothetical protein